MTAHRPRFAVALAALALALAWLGAAAGPPVSAAPRQEGPEARDEPGSNRRIEFASPGGSPLLLDIYYPALDGTPRPGIVLVHGGGWRRLDRSQLARMAGRFRDRLDAVVVTIDYRLDVFPSGFPAEVDDVDAALAWMRESADGWDVDPSRIALMGSSAGANLSLVAGLRETGAERVSGIVSLSAPVDLVALHGVLDMNQTVEYLGCEPSACPDLYAAASPLSYVSEDDPPVFVVNGANEEIPAAQAVMLDESLRNAGVESHLVLVEADGHGHGLANDVQADLDEFLIRTLRIGQPSTATTAPATTDDSVTTDDPPKISDRPTRGDSGEVAATQTDDTSGGGDGVPPVAVGALVILAGAAGAVGARTLLRRRTPSASDSEPR